MHPSESLAIINGMISTAKNKLADDGFLLIFWGWLVLAAALINNGCIAAGLPYGYTAWTLMPAGALISMVYGLKRRRRERVRTHLDAYLGYNWGGFIIGMVLALSFMPLHGQQTTYFFLMILYGMATFISGGLLRFTPLIVGSVFSFGFAAASAFAQGPEQLLCLAGAIFCSYVIPGHLLRARFRSQHDVQGS